MEITPGKYIGAVTAATVSEAKSGAVMIEICFDLIGAGLEGQSISANQCYKMKNGNISDTTRAMLDKCFGFVGSDPYWMEDAADSGTLAERHVELVIEEESFQGNDGNQKTVNRVKWINPLRGGMTLTNDTERSRMRAKHGFSGSAPAPVSSAPPSRTVAPAGAASMDSAWAAVNAHLSHRSTTDIGKVWQKELAAIVGEKADADITPAEWHQIQTACCPDEIPY